MNRRRADTVVGILVATVLLVGGGLSWQAYQQRRAFDRMGSMMGTSMGAVHGTNPLWYVLGTLLVAAVVGGIYLIVRDELAVLDVSGGADVSDRPPDETPPSTDGETGGSTGGDARPGSVIETAERPRARVLDLLPDDERRILDPVLSSPGITQIELRDRSDFSKSKVSQTVSDLERRGLLYRERQGRTYRIYPSDELRREDG